MNKYLYYNMPDEIEITKIDLTLISKVAKSGRQFQFNIPPVRVRLGEIKKGRWYKLFLQELSDDEVKKLGLEKS